MNLLYLKSFVALSETLRFGEAAARLQIAQPTLSQHIKKLEDHLGATLVTRAKNGCRLTQKGRLALPMARALIAGAERLARRVQTDTLSIAASGNIAGYFLGDVLNRLNAIADEGGAWTFAQATNVACVDMLERREVDIAITEWRPQSPMLETAFWRSEEMVVIASPAAPLAAQTSVSPEALLDLPVIGGEAGSGTGTLLRSLYGDAADAIKTVAELGSTEAVKSAVAANMGCSIVLRAAVAADVAAGRLVALRLQGAAAEKRFHVSTHRDADVDAAPLTRRAVDLILAHPH
ncbi:MAG: LysR family transcriptional regulator [Pseudomonadota bacterium]